MSLAIEEKRSGFLSGSTLKLIACIAMFIDHFGLVVFPKKMIFRIIGRLAFPIFAYFIAEGCKYTRNKLKHFLLIFSVGVIYFFFYLIAYDQVYLSIFLTFSVSILNIYVIDVLKKYAFSLKEEPREKLCGYIAELDSENGDENTAAQNGDVTVDAATRVNILRLLTSILTALVVLAASYIPFKFVLFDYGYIGMLAPVIISLFDFSKVHVPERIQFLDSKAARLVLLAGTCIALAATSSNLKVQMFGHSITVQVFNIFSIPILALYNGKVGIKKLKYFFYVFYPVHLGVIMGIEMLINILAK